jgi:hypothetical protein
MYAPGFNYEGHISANTVNGVFTAPVHTPPTTATTATTTVGSGIAPPVVAPIPPTPSLPPNTSSQTGKSILSLSEAERSALYSQVGDAMFAPGFSYESHVRANTVNGVFVAPTYIPPDTKTLL